MIINRNLGRALIRNGQYIKAEEVLNRALELDSTFNGLRDELGLAYLFQSMYEKALKEFKKENALYGLSLHWIGITYARMGKTAEAQKVFDELSKQNPDGCPLLVYFALGDNDKGFQCLEKACYNYDVNLVYNKIDIIALPVWGDLYLDPRFIAIQKKMGIK